MTIRARYPSRCARCAGPVEVGAEIEWVQGTPVRHAACPAAGAAPQPAASPAPERRPYRPTKCVVCGAVAQRDARGYPTVIIYRSGECQDCFEERKMGY